MTTYADRYEAVRQFVTGELTAGRQPGTLAAIGSRCDIRDTMMVSQILRNLETDGEIVVDRPAPNQRRANIYSLPGAAAPLTGQMIDDPIKAHGYTLVYPGGSAGNREGVPIDDYRRQEANSKAVEEWAHSLSLDEIRQLQVEDKVLLVEMFLENFGR